MKSPKSVVKATIKLVLYVRDYKVDSPLNLHRTASYIFVALCKNVPEVHTSAAESYQFNWRCNFMQNVAELVVGMCAV